MQSEKAKEIIQEYRETRESIRGIIEKLEREEYAAFKVMLDKLQALSDSAYSAQIYSELSDIFN